ncbi:MAG: SpoIID/LytB domain-containing protein [Bacteroidales bacterium]|nr:SpoIID/LytB domain-containing protein [Bacteroidales bacterium]MBR4453849.1 SpoIID/LytB domain-containing protein [Bacteroidales bacterium]MCR5555890.1 SpoIID/LytB domain-containing protein [Bacteroidales bacterium]
MSIRKFLAAILCLVASLEAFSLNIKVRLLTEYTPTSVVVSAVSGRYSLICDKQINAVVLEAGTSITLTYFGNRVKVEKGIELLGTFTEVEFIGTKYNNVFSLKTDKLPQERVYEENLSVGVLGNSLLLINTISLEKYVAGVVQSEVYGSSQDVEFFKIQAIASRTYCLANLNRHIRQGYNMCDAVHCQSYKGRCTQADIFRATYETFNDVIVDSLNRLISPAYHSNSGGMTESAGNIWQKDIPYLQSKIDTFSVGARNYEWEKIIPKRLWVNYFVEKYGEKYRTEELYQEAIVNFEQPIRKALWIIESDTIPTKDIRAYFKLRSAFFNVSLQGDNVYLKGKGYGHGVGLSQEGAIEMVRRGYSCEEILQFYFNNVRIIKYTEIIDL